MASKMLPEYNSRETSAVNRMAFRYKSTVALILMALGIGMISSAAQTDKIPPPELLQYIRDGKSHGLADTKIKKQAQTAGWPAASVDEAFTYLQNEKAAEQAARLAKTAEPSAAKQTPQQLQTPEPKIATPQEMATPPQTPAGQTPTI